jgi:hypothetical protein
MAFRFGNTGLMVHEANGEMIFSVGDVISNTQMKVTQRYANLYEAWKFVMERVGYDTVLPKVLEQYL